MSDKKIIIGDKMVESQLKIKSNMLGISMAELIDRYIVRSLFREDHYVPPKITMEEFVERGKKAIEKDKKRGVLPHEHNFAALIGRWNKSD